MSKTKYLRVTMPDGSQWDVPAVAIAEDRATHCAEQEPNRDPDYGRPAEVYTEELHYTLRNNSELIDWAENNMNWSDVSALARRVITDTVAVDYQEGWMNGDKEIVEVEDEATE